jgi:prepilin-type processing-associated H-X9-DG protein
VNDKGTHIRSLVAKLAAGAAIVVMAFVIFWPDFASGGGLFRAREQARRTSCLQNLKQLGLAMKQYEQDFRDTYPWRCGVLDPEEAWVDLGMLYPNYTADMGNFICPSARDRKFEPKCRSGAKEDYPLEPFKPANNKEVISYAYGYDSSGDTPTAWTEEARATLRLLADKKAGIEITDDIRKLSAHRDHGRNIVYHDGHVKWAADAGAVDPDPDDDAVGAPDAGDYTNWWSDPPWYGEGMEDEEAED